MNFLKTDIELNLNIYFMIYKKNSKLTLQNNVKILLKNAMMRMLIIL